MSRSPRIAVADIGGGFLNRLQKLKYAECLECAGARAVWIGEGAESPERLSRAYEGFLFPGGADLDPALYGRSPSLRCGRPDSRRDRFEPALLRAAMDVTKPVLGICRGFQLIAVVLGGSLYQDIGADFPGASLNHARFSRAFGIAHSVRVAERGLLASCVGAGPIGVNSLHHQAVDSIPQDLLPCAVSGDGIVEGLEAKDGRFLLAVQWHPELLAARYPRQRGLFDAFVRACAG